MATYRRSVKIKFEDKKTYVYNTKKPLSVGDKVKVGGAKADIVGEVLCFEGSWDNSKYAQEVVEVLERNSEPTEIVEAEIPEGMKIQDGILVSYDGGAEELAVPKGVIAIGKAAFLGNSTLTKVTIPFTVNLIEENAFESCFALQTVVFETLHTDKFENGLRKLGNGVFKNCRQLQNIQLPSTLIGIGEELFAQCDNLGKLVIPGTIATLPKYALKNISGLKELILEKGVQNIDDFAIQCCKNLQTLSFPSTLKRISGRDIDGTSIFYGCDSISEFIIDDKNKTFQSIDGNLYSKNGKILYIYAKGKKEGRVVIPEGVETIAQRAFCACETIIEVVLPNSLQEIQAHAFHESSLRKVELPDNIIKMGERALPYELPCIEESGIRYWGNERNPYLVAMWSLPKITGKLEHITFNERTRIIAGGLFNYNSLESCTSMDFPDSVVTIGANSFPPEKLEKVHFGKGLQRIGEGAFRRCEKLKDVSFPDGLLEIEKSAFSGCKSFTKIILPDSVQKIGEWSFADLVGYGGAKPLKEINLGKGLVEIGELAFNGSDVGMIVIPQNVQKIGKRAFEGFRGTIYAEAGSKPKGWADFLGNWGAINWGYKQK